MYKLYIVPSANKELKRLPKSDINQVYQRCLKLVSEPRPVQGKKLVGTKDLYRLRCGQWRVVYRINDKIRHITILRIRHRREAYR